MTGRIKRPRVEPSNSEAANNEDQEDGDDGSGKSSIGINALPEEMLEKIFSYLDHGDKLCARLVSTGWYTVMSSWVGFNNSAVYVLENSPGSEDTFMDSETTWRKLRIRGAGFASEPPNINYLPPQLIQHITSLEFYDCCIRWDTMKQNLTMFSSLQELCIRKCNIMEEKPAPEYDAVARIMRTAEVMQEKWDALLPNLKSLSVAELGLTSLARLLRQLTGMCNLVVFNLDEPKDGNVKKTDSACTDLLDLMYRIIYSSRKTLKILKFSLERSMFNDLIMTGVIERICGRGLDLVTFDLRGHAMRNRGLGILRLFLQTQGKLVNVTLPHVHEEVLVDECQMVMNNLPSTLQRLEVGHKRYLELNFLRKFPNLRHLGFDGDSYSIDSYLKRSKKYANIRTLKIRLAGASLSSLATSVWPRLVELHIDSERGLFNNRSLQFIIRDLKLLRSLTFGAGACEKIGDYGVTGIRDHHCKDLFQNRTLCLNELHKVSRDNVAGAPLSSLQGLTHLTFMERTRITDVGIFFGFRFKELRHLSMLNSHSGLRLSITDWGLDVLGKHNPYLDKLKMGQGTCVSETGESRLRQYLRRIRQSQLNVD